MQDIRLILLLAVLSGCEPMPALAIDNNQKESHAKITYPKQAVPQLESLDRLAKRGRREKGEAAPVKLGDVNSQRSSLSRRQIDREILDSNGRENSSLHSHLIQEETVAQAIYLAEGGEKTVYPYGVLSTPTYGNVVEAKRICLNSIRNSRKRWEKAGRPGDWLAYFAQRWCPVGAENDNGTNQYWLKNVRYFLDK